MSKITNQKIEYEIVNIFSLYKVMHPNQTLSFSDLTSEWKKTKLRQEDLLDGIKSLNQKGAFEVSKENNDVNLTITTTGQNIFEKIKAISISSGQDLRSKIALFVLNFQVARRERADINKNLKRRSKDQ